MSSAWRRTVLTLVILASAACDAEVSSTPNTAHVTGTVKSKNLTPRSAVAGYGNVTTSTANGMSSVARGLTILVSDKVNTCEAMHRQGATVLALSLPGAQVAPGTYAVVDITQKRAASGDSAATFDADDLTCKSSVTEDATTGTVTIKELVVGVDAGSQLRGSFTLGFSDGTLTGDFDALLCADTAASDAGSAPCTP